ncbi:hypothetical protein LSH36_12g03072 [Paralvinella palmiformis]|uniref:Uncharacterized protein n=1 Tax=Paralvinella palmiformis TaxID=53620 RepID=A0AAD9KE40_9ANNE|nr:hypothetical protein LSH36_12g03072 [Paralvinella palmiformis]
MSVIGFDFGYQTCYIAVARQGGIETVANEFSDRCTPAVVSFGERQRSIGGSAKQQIVSNFKNTVSGWKKLIARQFSDPQVQSERSLLPYDIVEQPDGTAGIQVYYLGEQQVFSPHQVTAMMFTKLKQVAEHALKMKIVDVVISVPCYFTDAERRAMLDASMMAGLNVLRLMNDTTATALAYGIYKQDLPGPDDKPRVTVFLDLGHSDLQMSAVAFNKAKLKVLATVADPNLGGRDFDMLLANHFAEEFKARYKVDAKTKPRAFIRLLAECEKLKKLMSANATDIPLNIECFMDDKDVSGKMNRATMEAMADGLFQRAKQCMLKLLQVANIHLDEIYAVEIMGGSSRIPSIKNLVKDVFGKEPSTTLNADEAVARGCALQCAILSPTFRVRDFSIMDAQPYPIVLSWQGAMDEESSSMEVFNVNHQIPFSKMLTFYRKESFTLHASYTDNNIPIPSKTIGTFTVQNVQPQPAGDSSKVKVKVRINIHGIFTVSGASMVEELGEVEEDTMEVENEQKNGAKKEKSEEGKQDEKSENSGETPMETDENEDKKSGAKNSSKEKKEETKDTKKKKKKVKVIDLPIAAQVAEISKVELNKYIEQEGQMIMQDKLEKERADAKNAVEEYVYEMRDKLYSVLELYVTEADRDALSLKLEDTENWLYDEGEDQNKQVYIDRLADLKKYGQPIVDRYREASERPKAFEALGAAIQKVQKVVDLYHAKDEKYNHLDPGDIEKVEKCLKEKIIWFEKNVNASNKQKPYENPAVLVSQIKQETQSLSNTCTPILTKPKPKPKEQPPEKNKEEKNGENNTTDKGEEAKKEEKPDDQNKAEQEANSPEMDLD